MTIFGHDGVSIGKGAIVTTGLSGFTSGFAFSPAKPKVGQKVTFSGLTAVSHKPVIAYLWQFGDGSLGSGPNPKQRTQRRAPIR